jgi:nucleotide-binding universal stress UspA family protein
MFRKILVPLDRSSLAEQAIGFAASIARESGATIDLVLVHEALPFAGYADLPWDVAPGAEQTYVAAIVEELASGAKVTASSAVLHGSPAEMICRHAGQVNADLIVMTSHGRTGFSRAWLGSVADAVMRNAAVPVLILRPERSDGPRLVTPHKIDHVLVPLDGSTLAASVVPAATDLARATHASIVLLRVSPVVPTVMPVEPTLPVTSVPFVPDLTATQQLFDDATRELDTVARNLHEQTGIAVEARVVESATAAAAIVGAVDAEHDIVAMSTHGRGASRWLVGSVADKVLRSSTVPVLLYRPAEIHETEVSLEDAEEKQPPPSLRATASRGRRSDRARRS